MLVTVPCTFMCLIVGIVRLNPVRTRYDFYVLNSIQNVIYGSERVRREVRPMLRFD